VGIGPGCEATMKYIPRWLDDLENLARKTESASGRRRASALFSIATKARLFLESRGLDGSVPPVVPGAKKKSRKRAA